MTNKSSPTTTGGLPPLSERRIVLLGKAGAGKNRVASVILGDTKLKEECEQCVLYEDEQAGRRICIVDTPGWDRVSIERTAKKIKNEITQSVALCPPGPHALILVLPVKTGDVPSLNELKSASQHMELLSERAWDHTMVLFLCDEDVEESAIKEHIQKAENLLEKCRGRHYVIQHSEPETHIHGLLKEIDNMVEENQDEFFLPQVYYEVMQSKIPQDIRELIKRYKDRLARRRRSVPEMPPSLGEIDKESMDIDAIESKNKDDIHTLAKYSRPISLLILTGIGALIGSVVGSNYGVVGSGVGIIAGIIITIPLALRLIDAASLARQSLTLVEERKTKHTD
ncbi:GTPase IMAP family member 4-like [Neoarius graeffei]|uniref:GTPase IMAP family member 4-like n=1 Tax=Neoarius graeffei TaxID=443677 RepID=UPI00298D3EA8|nr:GTPase IMAP family member 4-like [Neoarius graeffei]